MTELLVAVTVPGLCGLGFLAFNRPEIFLKMDVWLTFALAGFGIILVVNGMTIMSVLADITKTSGFEHFEEIKEASNASYILPFSQIEISLTITGAFLYLMVLNWLAKQRIEETRDRQTS